MAAYRKKRTATRTKKRLSKRISYRKTNFRRASRRRKSRSRRGLRRALRGRNSVYGTSGVRTLVIRHPEGQIFIKRGSIHEYTPNYVNFEGAYGPDATYSHQILAQMVNHWREFRIKKRVLKFWQGLTHQAVDTQPLTMYTLYDREANGRSTTVESMLSQPKCRIKFIKPGKVYTSTIYPQFTGREFAINTGVKGSATQMLTYRGKNFWLPMQYIDGKNAQQEIIKSVNTEHIMFTIPTADSADDLPICYREEIYYEFRHPIAWPINYVTKP